MKQRRRIYYAETDRALMWDRWEEGESLSSIARLFDRHHSAIQGILRAHCVRPNSLTRICEPPAVIRNHSVTRANKKGAAGAPFLFAWW